ncbi:transporter [Strigomonas culicis]|uniref:Transporter n=1 Tax=Strigomonas culicis TaxID=28005 RepID=S9U5Z8_9TRYP|nr:transporter [Strigomonas culicis]|eukprot:EPY24383.1 transporter [Strigomonas culicis]
MNTLQVLAPAPPPADPHRCESDMTALRNSQLFEGSAVLPLSSMEEIRISHLNFFKKWFLLAHLTYVVLLILLGTLLFLLFEPRSISFVDALFISTSAVCNCGLSTVNVDLWTTKSIVARHVIMFLGGVVFTSAFPSWLRLFLLRHVQTVFEEHAGDSPQELRLRMLKRAYAGRLRTTSLLSIATTYMYMGLIMIPSIVLLYIFNTSGFSLPRLLSLVTSSFHGCVFSTMESYVNDKALMSTVTFCCALGFTAFPVMLRFVFLAEHVVLRAIGHLRLAVSHRWRRARDRAEDEEALVRAPLLHTPQRALSPGVWDLAFNDMVCSDCPGTYHPFLFLTPETAFLGLAWCFFTVLLMSPIWLEQWDHALAPFASSHKVYIAVCQAASTRFAAATFVPISEFSNAHIALIILAMFLPALPISTDRVYRKWKQMFRTSLVRLLTSRLFWLFSAMLAILFVEEKQMREKVIGTRFDLMTRTFFEVVSAYSGCGLSLSLPITSTSFIGDASTFSKVVIVLVLVGGRHRFVDLGIDLGFATLQDASTLVPSHEGELDVSDPPQR